MKDQKTYLRLLALMEDIFAKDKKGKQEKKKKEFPQDGTKT